MPYPVSAIQTAAQVPEIVAIMPRSTGIRKQELYHKSRWKSRLNAPELQLFSFGTAAGPPLPTWGEEPERAIDINSSAQRRVRQSRAMASARKPVIVRKFSRDWFAGYVGADFGQLDPELEILDLSGKVVRMAWRQVKWVCYVRDFPAGGSDQSNPERLLRKRFSVRPRAPGLWMRLTLTDGDELEGLAANDRTLVEGAGLLLTPPDTRSNTQRIYLPRQAIQALEVVSLIGAAGSVRSHPVKRLGDQPDLFPGEGSAG